MACRRLTRCTRRTTGTTFQRSSTIRPLHTHARAHTHTLTHTRARGHTHRLSPFSPCACCRPVRRGLCVDTRSRRPWRRGPRGSWCPRQALRFALLCQPSPGRQRWAVPRCIAAAQPHRPPAGMAPLRFRAGGRAIELRAPACPSPGLGKVSRAACGAPDASPSCLPLECAQSSSCMLTCLHAYYVLRQPRVPRAAAVRCCSAALVRSILHSPSGFACRRVSV